MMSEEKTLNEMLVESQQTVLNGMIDQEIQQALKADRQQLVEKLKPMVYGYDEDSTSGAIEWRKVLKVLQED